jgi:hypothetical protein
VTESGDINAVALRDVENALAWLKTKFIPIDYHNILIGHFGIASFLGRFEEGTLLTETLGFVNEVSGCGLRVAGYFDFGFGIWDFGFRIDSA